MSSTDTRPNPIGADTIFALATAPGKSGVAIIRLSGPLACRASLLLTSLPLLAPRHAVYATLRIPGSGEIIDRGLALYFRAPHSFTGEDVVELQTHGSLAVIRQLLEALSGMDGLRPAEPGEFTRRAFINGKMDLLEAEGLADLVDAQTPRQKMQALRQMEGELSGFYEHLREQIIQCLAHLEAYIDFPDEDIPESVLAILERDIAALATTIASQLDDRRRGERLRDGINIVILGAPNAGKSSLINAIAKRDVAIVSYKPGTTRDAIEIHSDIAGYPVVFVDTAGLRDSDDEIEAEGVRRALERGREADLKLVLFDGAQWPGQDAASLALLDEQSLSIITKKDLATAAKGQGAIAISTRTGEGMEALLKAIENRIVAHFSDAAAPMITRNRHRVLLSDALKYLTNSQKTFPLELKCEELRLAAQAVGKITGKIQIDDVLDVIFKRFCIGK